MEYIHDRTKSGIPIIIRPQQKQGFRLGALTYYQIEQDTFRLNSVYVDEEHTREGIGSGLVREFARTIGSDKRVTALITNFETLERLYESGILTEARVHHEMKLDCTHSLLTHLPMIRVMAKGGIYATGLTINNFAPVLPNIDVAENVMRKYKGNTGALYGMFGIEYEGRTRARF